MVAAWYRIWQALPVVKTACGRLDLHLASTACGSTTNGKDCSACGRSCI